MDKDLTASHIQRQNVLNNRFAIEQIEGELALGGVIYDNTRYFIKPQVARLLEVDERTIDRYLHSHNEELARNGYSLLNGEKLRKFKELFGARDMNVVSKTTQLGIFSFKSVLNLAMLLTESERAREIRSRILDVVIDIVTQKVGGHTKYINQHDEDYLPAAFQEENYRKLFTDAVDNYIDTKEPWKYGKYTNLIYKAIFEEDASEYKKILNLSKQDSVRETFYTEVLTLIASFEAGLAEHLKHESEKLGRKLSVPEADTLFSHFGKQAAFKPLVTNARSIMASRDLTFRDALHHKLEAYIKSVPEADYERFLGEKSKALEERIKESIEVYKRLKDR